MKLFEFNKTIKENKKKKNSRKDRDKYYHISKRDHYNNFIFFKM